MLLDTTGQAKVGDFGLAASARALGIIRGETTDQGATDDLESERLTMAGKLVGTPLYMSPEQHAGRALGPRGDMYSFCLSLLEALCGENPLAGLPPRELRRAKRRKPLRGASFSGLPFGVARVIKRGLAPKPADRWPSMNELLRALEGRRRRRTLLLAAAAVLPALALAAAIAIPGEPTSCVGATVPWSDQTRHAIEAQFRSTRLPFADASAREATRRLDDYSRLVDAVRGEACDTLDEDARRRALQCADRRDGDLAALVEVFEDADADVVSNAVLATARLPPPRWCLDAAARDRAEPTRPPEPARLREELESVVALELAGKFGPGLHAATSLEREARAVADDAFLAEVLLQLGRLKLLAGDEDDARASLLEAFGLAQASADDKTALTTAIQLIELAARSGGTDPEADDWVRHAQTALARLGEPPDAAAELSSALGLLAHARGKPDAARSHLERAVSLYGGGGHGSDILGAVAVGSLAVACYAAGDYDASRQYHARSLQLLERLLGPSHPTYAAALDNAGAVHSALGEVEQAATMHAEALAVLDTLPGADPVGLSITLNNLAAAQRRLGNDEEARDLYQRAIEILEQALGPDHPQLVGPLNNAGALERARGSSASAAVLHLRALAIAERSLGAEHPGLTESLTGLGYARYASGDAALAIELFTRAIDMCPDTRVAANCARARFGRAQARRKVDDGDAAATRDARAARAIFGQLRGTKIDKELAAVDAWLAPTQQASDGD